MAKDKEEELVYDSNPFSNALEAFGKLFKFNQAWAIVMIALAVVGTIASLGFQIIGTVIDSFDQRDDRRYVNRYVDEEDRTTNFEVDDDGRVIVREPGKEESSVDWRVVALIIALVAGIIIVASLVSAVIQTFIGGMFSYVSLQSLDEKTVSFSEAWQVTLERFWRLFLASLLASLKIFGWTLLLIIPGIIAAYRYALLPFVIMDEKAGKSVGDSHRRVKELTRGRLWEVFGMATVAGLIPIVGQTIGQAGNAALYRQLQVYGDSSQEKPKIHWLNYLGIIIAGAILVLIIIPIVVILVISAVSN